MKTEIAKDIERAGAMIQYDAQCKKVLSNIYVLAWIMQTAVEECYGLSINRICQCIEGQPQISTVCVDPDREIEEKTTEILTKEKIEGLNTEDKDAVEGKITYDIRFAAYVPSDAGKIKILVDVEAQQKFSPGYPIVSRGMYYGARMVSSQNGVEFAVPDYGDIKKVYSIWICPNAPNYLGNAMTVYRTEKVDVYGNRKEAKENYDKVSVVMIYLNQVVQREKGFFDMMNVLLSPEMDVEMKKSILWNEYHIPMERGFVKEVELMCDLSQWVLEIGMQKGIQTGIQTGIQRGVQQKEREIVENLLKEGSTDAFIMKVAGITYEQLCQIKEECMCLA